MGSDLKMSVKLSQQMQLRMTPELQQAIKLLQLSQLELQTEIRKELVENPVLEEVVDLVDEDPARKDAHINEDIQKSEEKSSTDSDPTQQDEFDWEKYVDSINKTPSAAGSGGSDEIMNYENIISTERTLHEHLHWQAGMVGFSDDELDIVSVLISYIDEDGWIKTSLKEIAEQENFKVDDPEILLEAIQEFDPPGVGARDLRECLLLQARHLQEDTKDLTYLIDNHLKELESRNFAVIAKEMEISTDHIIELWQLIRNMDPKPGLRFGGRNDTQFAVPDVYVRKVSGEYVIDLNQEGVPQLRISNMYKNLLKNKGDKNAKDFIKEKLSSAMWLIRSIEQRKRTIYKVAKSILKHQEDFFEKGSSYIRPMILKDVADDIEMHESTVSRVTNNKYLHCVHGTFELKYFFSGGFERQDGSSLASESVKVKIKELVQAEDLRRPLSDQRIVDLLKKDGISIARRTVAKYRDVLKILPSSKRKKFY